ncbi:HNH endonuclease [Pseudalkalibacillus hwajinpoensis]|uniref:HNH endonuclease n=1 Tax=Guptibacillus hwajinpoensis TaxID=208199 RepID=UPI001CFEAC03|nr:HNH endonuclease [Pseudalkalibacillus hwajinpoensis]
MGVAEAITQSFSDTYEDEGVAYVAGNVSTAFIPYVGMAGKSASLAKVAGKIPNSNLSKVAGSSKVDVAAIVKKHNAFEGIKRGMGEFVQDVKGGMQVAGDSNRVAFGANGIAGNSLGRVEDVAESGVASVIRSGGPNHVVDDSIMRIKTEVERVDGGKESPPNKSINKQIYEKEMVKALKEQPLYNRKPNKPRNFTSKIRNEDGSTTYTFTSTKNGEEYAVTYDKTGFPIFNSKYEVTLEEKLYLETDAVQFNYASKQLYKEINRNPELANQFNSQEINILEAGRVPQNLTWHHHQIPGKMQIVDYFEHQSASHTGGRAIWGGGEAGRRGEIKKKILERIKWE